LGKGIDKIVYRENQKATKLKNGGNEMNVSLRPATHEDFSFVFQLNKINMKKYVEKLRGWDEQAERLDMKAKFKPFVDQIIVVYNYDVGIFAVDKKESEFYLRHIEILPAYQNKGIGSFLLHQILREADKRCITVKLQVLKLNPARRLYERLGFSVYGESELKYKMVYAPK
jgi:ribosomal protein S18 acetylase RimI-like enzyme